MTTRISSNVLVRDKKIPFQSLVNDDEFESGKNNIGHAHDGPKFKNMVDRLVGSLRKQKRYADERQEYRHERLPSSEERPRNLEQNERTSSLAEINDICDFDKSPSEAFMGRRRSRSDTDLITSEIFARRRAAICDEMEKSIMMADGVTLRKCRKNLVLNRILVNLSLLWSTWNLLGHVLSCVVRCTYPTCTYLWMTSVLLFYRIDPSPSNMKLSKRKD